ncbi:MAG: hypothetical protein INR73_10870 [Williamsia sp.]|nr:hypothetical protein [Williamsia sp.]
MKTKYITYCKNGPTEESNPTEFEFAYPALPEEHDAVSHELVNVQIAENKIYYTFRLETRLKEPNYHAGLNEDQEVSPFER